MIENQPSRTAERVAMRRAVHQLIDRPPVFEDPLALAILGPVDAAALVNDAQRLEEASSLPSLRAFLAARSRLAEDTLAQAVAAGVRRYVVLGAGLDTFAYRHSHAGLEVVEVDHPATQGWKRQRLLQAGIAVPAGVRYVAVDFATDDLRGALDAAGLGSGGPAFFSWLGVTQYLVPDDVLATLEVIARFSAHGGGVVFDYSLRPEAMTPEQRRVYERLSARVAAAGETFRGTFEPAALAGAMRAMGFTELRDLGPDDLNATYFAQREDGLHVRGAGRIMVARG